MKPLPEKTIVLTFDDAVISQYTIVAPILRKHNFNATFFVCEFPVANEQEQAQCLTWRQIAELADMGFEIGNHTRTHCHIGKVSLPELEAELDYIDNACQKHGIAKTTTFAYPGYGLNPEAFDLFAKRGFLFARAGWDRCYNPGLDHPYLLPSFDIAGTDEAKVLGYLKQAKPGHVAILTIHGVPDILHPWVNIQPELFEKYLQFLKENGYAVLALRDLAQYANPVRDRETIKPDFSGNQG